MGSSGSKVGRTRGKPSLFFDHSLLAASHSPITHNKESSQGTQGQVQGIYMQNVQEGTSAIYFESQATLTQVTQRSCNEYLPSIRLNADSANEAQVFTLHRCVGRGLEPAMSPAPADPLGRDTFSLHEVFYFENLLHGEEKCFWMLLKRVIVLTGSLLFWFLKFHILL